MYLLLVNSQLGIFCRYSVQTYKILFPHGLSLPWLFVSLRSAAMQPCKSSLKPWFLTSLISPSRWSCILVHRCFHFQVSFSLYFRCLSFPRRVRLCQRSAVDGPTGFALTLDFLPSFIPGFCDSSDILHLTYKLSVISL